MGNLLSQGETTITTTPIYIEQPLATEIITKQTQLISNLEDAIKQTRTALVINANPTSNPTALNNTISWNNAIQNGNSITKSKEKFMNVNPVSDYYTPSFYLANTNTPELKDYVDAYNKSVALLDDPNQLNQAKFDTYIHLQNKKIAELQNAINTFPTKSAIHQPIKAIKNLKTSQSLNVEEYPDPANNNSSQPKTYRGNGAPEYPNYLIYGNNGCLQYNKGKDASTAGTWAFQPCNSNMPEQRFNMTQINTMDNYNNKITDIANQSYKIADTNSVIMGFYVVNPETANDQCLTLNPDGLSVMPCNIDASQRFKPFYHSITP